jgi:hypothetical protein
MHNVLRVCSHRTSKNAFTASLQLEMSMGSKASPPWVSCQVVRVEDGTGGAQLRGKQSLNPRGIWYSRVSGIWQAVWLEAVTAQFFCFFSSNPPPSPSSPPPDCRPLNPSLVAFAGQPSEGGGGVLRSAAVRALRP